jgi:transcription elongation factor GreA
LGGRGDPLDRAIAAGRKRQPSRQKDEQQGDRSAWHGAHLPIVPREDRVAKLERSTFVCQNPNKEVERFVRWCGADRILAELRGHEVATYAETLTGGVTDAGSRADAVRKFLAFAKKAGHTTTNLGTHIRLRKQAPARPTRATAMPIDVEMSEEERTALSAELDSLKAQRPQIVRDLQRAMADKDFRENAPLDAARERQGYVEGRIRALEQKLDRAVIVGNAPASRHFVEVGSTVLLRNLQSGAEVTYTLVRPGEVNAGQGRISFESPVGSALLQRQVGDEVEVTAPSGTLRFRIERVQG